MPAAIAFIPHPDDESYSFGGLLALLARAGWSCVIHCASSGEGGERFDGSSAGQSELAQAREAELKASCAILGVDEPVFWQLPDGGTRAADVTTLAKAAVLSQRCDLVLTLGQDGAYGHPDHLAVYAGVMAAWMQAGSPAFLLCTAFPPGLFIPQYEKCVASGIMGNPPLVAPEDIGAAMPTHEVEIGEVAGIKLQAIAAHRTQLPGGDPHALFPPGIVESLLSVEHFLALAGGGERAANLLAGELPAPLLMTLRPIAPSGATFASQDEA